ncbi:hypothetical protein HN011_004980 [Eciton burchellii]|nr:hypothetical protein HN011_004980 [Eciton burchellii]
MFVRATAGTILKDYSISIERTSSQLFLSSSQRCDTKRGECLHSQNEQTLWPDVNNCQFDPYNVSYDGTATLLPGNNHSMLIDFAVTTQETNLSLKITTEFNCYGYIRITHRTFQIGDAARSCKTQYGVSSLFSPPWQTN